MGVEASSSISSTFLLSAPDFPLGSVFPWWLSKGLFQMLLVYRLAGIKDAVVL